MSDAAHWDDRYAASEQVWSVEPNRFVEEFCHDLPTGRALDLAAGEGRNALWLAERGWTVTAVDFSAVGLQRAAASAAARKLDVDLVQADLRSYIPEPSAFDLVVIAYLHLPAPEIDPILHRAAAAVAPGGSFVLVGHDLSNLTGGFGGPQDPSVLCTSADIVAAIAPPLAVERAEVVTREVVRDGETKTALDTIVVARR